MPRWIHERAKHMLAKNPDMSKSTAFAVATQQAGKLGKGATEVGIDQAKDKAIDHYRKPKREQRPNPGNLETPKLASVTQQLVAEMRKEADARNHEPERSRFTPPLEGSTRDGVILGGGGAMLGYSGIQTVGLSNDLADAFINSEHGDTKYLDDTLLHKVRQSSSIPIVDMPQSADAMYTSGLSKKELRRARAVGVQFPPELNPKKPHIYIGSLSNTPSIVAHELGHHELNKGRLGRLLQSRAGLASSKAAPLAALIAGTVAGASDDTRVQVGAGLAAGAMAAPELLYEAGASLNADKLLRRSGAPPKQLALARKAMASAYGTYLGKGVLTAGLGLGAMGLARAWRGDPKEGEKLGFQTSEYSGPLNPIRMQHASYMPAFSSPPVKTAGPPPSKGKLKKASSPMMRLNKMQAVGLPKPKLPAPPGPSVAQIAKPKGFGKPIAGATKTFR